MAPRRTPFGRSTDRKLDRRLLAAYEAMIDEVLRGLEVSIHATAVELAALPEQIPGYGHLGHRYAEHAEKRQRDLLAAFRRKENRVTEAGKVRKTIAVIPG